MYFSMGAPLCSRSIAMVGPEKGASCLQPLKLNGKHPVSRRKMINGKCDLIFIRKRNLDEVSKLHLISLVLEINPNFFGPNLENQFLFAVDHALLH
jgi:hypothetical protein